MSKLSDRSSLKQITVYLNAESLHYVEFYAGMSECSQSSAIRDIVRNARRTDAYYQDNLKTPVAGKPSDTRPSTTVGQCETTL